MSTGEARGIRVPRVVDGRYHVERVLGRGGMGAVFEVRDAGRDERLALKRLLARDGAPMLEGDILRFKREFHTLIGLAHPNVARAFEYGMDETGPYYTMELLDGRDLRECGALPWSEVCSILVDVASALALLHARKLLHRDLSARNVRLTADGTAKLFDFGVIGTIGEVGELAGTPPIIPPEVLRGEPLDARVDLFALGALGYVLLTGRHAYPAKRFGDLFAAWAEKPKAVAKSSPGVPKALDDLLLSLLSLDADARPGSAAEVIERLTAIASLPKRTDENTAQAYLKSVSIVGRKSETTRLRTLLERALAGAGHSVVIEAQSGMGKSRLLREVAIGAQLSGALCVLVDAGAASGAYGLARAISRELLAVAPEDALNAARPYLRILGKIVPELGHRGKPGDALHVEPEERLRVQDAFASWFVSVATSRRLALIVDDVQRADEGSLSLMAALATQSHDTSLLLALAHRTDEGSVAPASLRKIASLSERMKLRGLDDEAMTELVHALFGVVPNAAKLARLLVARASGSPLLSMEIARTLVRKHVIRYVDGLWSIPPDLSSEEAPSILATAMDARVASLAAEPRRVADALSVLGGKFDLETCAALTAPLDAADLFQALDELVREEVLVVDGARYRFRHDGVREALVRALGDESRLRLHARAAQALMRDGVVTEDREADVGFHWLRAGETDRGATILARAGQRAMEVEAMADAIAPLEAALTAFERDRAPLSARLELRSLLLRAGVVSNLRVVTEYLPESLALARRASGLDLAQRYVPESFPRATLFVAAIVSLGRRLVDRTMPSIASALASLAGIGTLAAITYYHSFDTEKHRALLRTLRPFEVFRGKVAHAALEMARAYLDIPEGRRSAALARLAAAKVMLETDRETPLRDLDRRSGIASCLNSIAWIRAEDQDPTFEEALAAIEPLDLASFRFASIYVRATFHRFRGEELEAERLFTQVEDGLVKLGSPWIWERGLAWYPSFAYAEIGDVLGLKRAIEQMTALKSSDFFIDDVLELARAEYQRARGDLGAARVTFEALLGRPTSLVTPRAQLGLGETLLELEELELAEQACALALALARSPEIALQTLAMRAERALALVEARKGELRAAAQRLDRTIAEAARLDSPAIDALVYDARARVAKLEGDPELARVCFDRVRRAATRTGNPVLGARADRLEIELYGRGVSTAPKSRDDQAVDAAEEMVSRVVRQGRGRADRANRLLDLFVAQSGADAGYLFLREGAAMRLAAPSSGLEPPDAVVSLVDELLGSEESSPTRTRRDVEGRHAWSVAPLLIDREGEAVVVGAVAVRSPRGAPLDPLLLKRAAESLTALGDISRVSLRAAPRAPSVAG